jgi:hypothetical protein
MKWGKMNAYRILVKSHGEKRNHQEDQDVGGWILLKMDFRDIGWGSMDWTYLA